MQYLYDHIAALWREPFRQPMDAVSLFLVAGLILVILLLWGRILAAIQE